MVGRRQSGYVGLMAVLIVGSVSTAIALTLLTTGVDSQRAVLVQQQSKQARGLALACAEEALQQIHDNAGFTGSNSLTLGQGTCNYTVTVAADTTRSIAAIGTVQNVVKKIQAYVTIVTSSISITSWQEVG